MDEDQVFTTKLGIGSFIVLVTLVAELAVLPLFEILKNRLTNAIAIHRVANSKHIVLRSDKWWSHLLGVSDHVRSDTWSFRTASLIRLLLKGVIIGMLVYWESSANEVTVVKLSNQQLAEGKDELDGIRIMSPMPFTGLAEGEIDEMVTFQPNGVKQDGGYVVLDGEDFKFSGDDACTSVFDGRLTIYLSRVEIRQDQISNMCLDGKEGRPKEVAAELNIRSKNQTSYALDAITLTKFVATDRLSAIYTVTASHDMKDMEGYAALTKNSHENGNTVWSLYGLLHEGEGRQFEYLNIPITASSTKPCMGNEIGIWRLSESSITCPDGTPIVVPMGTEGIHVVDANWVIPTSKDIPREDLGKLALQWVAETPFSKYVAKTKLSEEIWSRMHREVYFVSSMKSTIELPTSETVKYTQTSRKRVIITTATLCVVLLILLIFFAAEQMQRWKYDIKMDFCDIGSALGMWNSEVTDAGTCAVSSTSVTVGLTENGDVGSQHIGTLSKLGGSTRSVDDSERGVHILDTDEMPRRDPKRPLE